MFKYDKSGEYVEKINGLLRDVREEDSRKSNN